jgi:hypothetical protein
MVGPGGPQAGIWTQISSSSTTVAAVEVGVPVTATSSSFQPVAHAHMETSVCSASTGVGGGRGQKSTTQAATVTEHSSVDDILLSQESGFSLDGGPDDPEQPDSKSATTLRFDYLPQPSFLSYQGQQVGSDVDSSVGSNSHDEKCSSSQHSSGSDSSSLVSELEQDGTDVDEVPPPARARK